MWTVDNPAAGYYTDFIADSAQICEELDSGLSVKQAQVWAIDTSTYIGAMITDNGNGGEHNNNCMGYVFGEYAQVVAANAADGTPREYTLEVPDVTELNSYHKFLEDGDEDNFRNDAKAVHVFPSAVAHLFSDVGFRGEARLLHVGIYVEGYDGSTLASDLDDGGNTLSSFKVSAMPQAQAHGSMNADGRRFTCAHTCVPCLTPGCLVCLRGSCVRAYRSCTALRPACCPFLVATGE